MSAAQMEDFVDPASISDELLCSICTGVFVDPRAGPCGHSFCGFCLEQWLERSAGCPLCRGELPRPDVADRSALRERCDALRVRCPWRCEWVGRRDEQGAHMMECSAGHPADVAVRMEGPMGVRLETIDDLVFVSSLGEGGAARRYNETCKNAQAKQIRVNDQIMLVDGLPGDAAMICYLLRRPSRKIITFRHPKELAISVATKGKKLGIELTWSDESGVPTVLGVHGGALEECNSLARSPSGRLLKNDRIIEVNGVSCVGSPDSVVPMLAASEELSIRFHRRRLNSVCSL